MSLSTRLLLPIHTAFDAVISLGIHHGPLKDQAPANHGHERGYHHPNTIAINSLNPDPRSKFVLERLVYHLHDFARETRLSSKEWMASIQFLTAIGQICTDVRQEFILLSDVFGLSLLVDAIDHPKPPSSTEGTVLGPFHTHEAEVVAPGTQISKDENGEPLLVICSVMDTAGRPIESVSIDIWETDSGGFYDVQHSDKDGPDG